MSTAVALPAGRMPEFPPGIDARPLMRDLLHSSMWAGSAAVRSEARRQATRNSPIAFAIVYYGRRLRSPLTGNRLTFSPFHVSLHRSARRWASQGPAVAYREGRVAPRGAGKTMWDVEILPLWAMAHGHRTFPLLFGDTAQNAARHFDDLRDVLNDRSPESELILTDYPHLKPLRGRNTANAIVTVGSKTMPQCTVMCTGMNARNLGIRSAGDRPNLIIGDDLEPPDQSYSLAGKRKRLDLFLHTALPMNERAVVLLNGTAVMWGAIMHDVVRAAAGEPDAPAWIAEEGFVPMHFPAIIDDPETGPRSMWPQRWSIEWLLGEVGKRAFAFNYLGVPPPPGSRLWREGIFKYRRGLPITEWVISIDGAVTQTETSDYTAMVIAGWSPASRQVVIAYANQWRCTGRQLREKILQAKRENPHLKRVILEKNQGGERWSEILLPLPGMELELYASSAPKPVRLGWAFDQYERGAVVHTERHVELEEQALDWPDVEHDDLIDANAAAIDDLISRCALGIR